mgnify:CR=1 FL=1
MAVTVTFKSALHAAMMARLSAGVRKALVRCPVYVPASDRRLTDIYIVWVVQNLAQRRTRF